MRPFSCRPGHGCGDNGDRELCYFWLMLRTSRSALALCLLVLAPAGLAACGGGDEEASAPVTTPEPAPSALIQAELISAGDTICAEINAAVGTIQTSETSDETIKATQIADLYSGLAERLDGLGIPTDGDPPVDVIATAEALGDPATSDQETALAEFQQTAADYGFRDCAESPSAPISTGTDTDAGTDSGTDTGTDTGGTVEPAPAPEPAPVAPPDTGGGVTPAPPDTGGGSGGSSGGISPG